MSSSAADKHRELHVPKLALTGRTTATTYHFRPEPRGFGWARCTVNDHTGELLIMSDWGHWSHRWSSDPNHLGHPTLTHFLGERAGCDYLANKLTTREQRQRFDPGQTIASFRKMLCEHRLALRDIIRPRLTRELARELWDEIGDIDADDATVFVERFMQIDSYAVIHDEPWEALEYKPTTEYTVLLHGILPALVEACAAEVQRPAELEPKEAARG